MNVFTYGSLMFDPVWATVVAGRGYRSAPATLTGYRRFAVSGQSYPGVIAAPGGEVEGRLYYDVDKADLARLDAFEGGDYARIAVDTRVIDDGRELSVPAGLYLYLPAERLESRDWDPEWFAREGIHRFIRDYCPTPEGPAPKDGSG